MKAYASSGRALWFALLSLCFIACGRGSSKGLDCPDGATPVGQVGEGTWCEKDGSVKHGPYRLWRPNGTIAMEGVYRDGLKEGEWASYWDNGRLHEKGLFRVNEKVGRWRSFRPDGTLDMEAAYDDAAKPHGLRRIFNADGSHYQATCYRHGEQLWKKFLPKEPIPPCPVDER